MSLYFFFPVYDNRHISQNEETFKLKGIASNPEILRSKSSTSSSSSSTTQLPSTQSYPHSASNNDSGEDSGIPISIGEHILGRSMGPRLVQSDFAGAPADGNHSPKFRRMRTKQDSKVHVSSLFDPVPEPTPTLME